MVCAFCMLVRNRLLCSFSTHSICHTTASRSHTYHFSCSISNAVESPTPLWPKAHCTLPGDRPQVMCRLLMFCAWRALDEVPPVIPVFWLTVDPNVCVALIVPCWSTYEFWNL